MQEASHGMSRTFPPTAPVSKFYRTAPMPRSPTPGNLISLHAAAQASVDPRLTAQGDWNTGKRLPPYVPYGYIDPRNVFSLRPA